MKPIIGAAGVAQLQKRVVSATGINQSVKVKQTKDEIKYRSFKSQKAQSKEPRPIIGDPSGHSIVK